MSHSSVLYIPHGGGPMPLLSDPGHQELVDFLSKAANELPSPEAIVIVSAHWEETIPTITAGASPPLFYDYYGFPDEAYQIGYPAPGNPDLAKTIAELLGSAGIKARLDDERGFDHGMFVPLKLMYPNADIPCVQLSLVRGLDPALHVRMGRALSPLRNENILLVGSGMSYHNLREFFTPDGLTEERNQDFHDWLVGTCTGVDLKPTEREAQLIDWTSAPYARFCHPRAEHLVPLHVCYGIATGDGASVDRAAAKEVFAGEVMERRVTALLWD
ncbi:MAG: class III extradiol ring-cleavage dioxygenase [Spirochaetaceae bacterium]|nr:class III extradiol ring-cleavage dioxygenase [Spirochaetaceae bacterium]MDT8297582.1 class III extradiol ring-cleavage dioxygenase [Spirochaetaceae bacterium]